MSIRNFPILSSLLAICVLFPAMRSQADVIVYKEMCGSNAYTDWNLTCKIDKNTLRSAALVGTGVDRFKDVQSITICAPFSNRGGLGPLTIVYNNRDGSQSMPTHVFETVKHRGNLLENRVTWVGMSPRFGSNFKSQGELLFDEKKGTFAYAEILSDGSKSLGELRAANCNRFFADEMPEGTEMPRRTK